MGVAEQIQEDLRQGRTPEEILERLTGKGLSEINARRFLERAQASLASGAPSAPAVRPRSPAPGSAARPGADSSTDDDAGSGTWSLAAGAFFFVLGAGGTALTYIVAKPGGKFVFLYGAILWGLFSFVRGLMRWRRGGEPFPALIVGAATAVPVVLLVGIFIQQGRLRAQGRERALDMVREESQRRGVDTGGPTASLDPVSAYIVVLKNGARDPDSQRQAAWKLGEMRQAARDAVPTLLAALRSPSALVRNGAAEALLKIAPEDPAVVTAVKAQFTDPSLEVWAIVGDFARKGDPDAIKALLLRLEDPELWARAQACRIVGTLRDKPAFAAPLIIAKVKSEDWRVRAACAGALGALGSATPEARAALEEAAASPIPDVKKSATDALARLASGGR